MIIVNGTEVETWVQDKVDTTVRAWFEANSGKWFSDFLTANPTFTYQQVAWALGFMANNSVWPFTALPTSDSELALAMQMNQMYHG